jgi:hypothetical protein
MMPEKLAPGQLELRGIAPHCCRLRGVSQHPIDPV